MMAGAEGGQWNLTSKRPGLPGTPRFTAMRNYEEMYRSRASVG